MTTGVIQGLVSWLEDEDRRRPTFRGLASGERSSYNSGMAAKKEKSILELFEEGTAIDEALRQAVREALLFHKKLGNPIAVWKKGNLVWIPPEEIDPDQVGAADSADDEESP